MGEKQKTLGGKELGLIDLQECAEEFEYIVPERDVLPSDLYENPDVDSLKSKVRSLVQKVLPKKSEEKEELSEDLLIEIKRLVKKYAGKKVKVRSNSILEDSSGHSFSGVYHSETVEEVTEKSLLKAVLNVYKSLHSPKAKKYRKDNKLGKDEMSVIVQEFIEGDYSGTMYTSSSSAPDDIIIDTKKGSEKEERDHTSERFILEYAKELEEDGEEEENENNTGPKMIFASENWEERKEGTKRIPKSFNALAVIGKHLEERYGASDIEFVIQDRVKEFTKEKKPREKKAKIYLVQKRAITDTIEDVEDVEIPEYEPEQFLGETSFIRGKGKHTLPVVKMINIDEVHREALHEERRREGGEATADGFAELDKSYKTEWLEEARKRNLQYPNGYVLVTTVFNETFFEDNTEQLMDLHGEKSFDELTSNKKAIITTRDPSILGHAPSLARSSGLQYAGFQEKDGVFKKVETGDTVTLYYKKRSISLYKEKVKPPTIKEFFDVKKIKIEKEPPFLSITIEEPESETKIKRFYEGFLLFLNEHTGERWSFEEKQGYIGGEFINLEEKEEEDAIILTGHSSSTNFSFQFSNKVGNFPTEHREITMEEEDLQKILETFVKYLKSK
jgi:hypothetical protein